MARVRRYGLFSGERRTLDLLPGVPAGVRGMPGPLRYEAQVLGQGPAERDVEDLDAAARPQDRQAALHGPPAKVELERVAVRLWRREQLVGRLAVAGRLDVTAASEEDSVAGVERLVEERPVQTRKHQRDAAGKGDRALMTDAGIVAEVVQAE